MNAIPCALAQMTEPFANRIERFVGLYDGNDVIFRNNVQMRHIII